MVVAVEEFNSLCKLREQLKSPKEITLTEGELGYPHVQPYSSQPMIGSTAFLYMKRIKEKHLEDVDWVQTSVLHDIYYSAMGSHNNLLIKLAKSKYLETKIETIIVDAETTQGVMPRKVESRLWRLTKKGLDYLSKNDLTFEELVVEMRKKVIRRLEKKGIEYEITYADNPYGIIAFESRWGRVEYRFEDLAKKPSMMQVIYNQTRTYSYEVDKETEEKFEEAKRWLREHPKIKTSMTTPIGTISIEGDVKSNHMALNGKRICVVPNLPIHHADVYICRLAWLNYNLDELTKFIVRAHILKSCPNCGYTQDYGTLFHDNWKYCPMCAVLIDDMIEDYIIHRRW